MFESIIERAGSIVLRINTYLRSWMTRRTAYGVAIALVIYALAGFVGVPYAIRNIVPPKAAAAVNRSVKIDGASFNPFTLRLDLRGVHVGERDGGGQFVDIGRFHTRVSWTSIL